MDRSSRATVVFRVGTLLVAIALAFGLISYMSSLTVSGYHSDQCFYNYNFGPFCENVDVAPAGTYTVLASWDAASPQQMYFFNMSSTGAAEVYLLNTNQTAFDVWIANKSGLPLANVSFSYGPQELAWFSDYVASHGQEVEGRYAVSGTNLVVKYFVPDVEPLMAVVTNGNAGSSLNFTYSETNVGVMINPSLGLRATGYLAASGAVVAVFGLVLKRRGAGRSGGSPTSSSAKASVSQRRPRFTIVPRALKVDDAVMWVSGWTGRYCHRRWPFVQP
ncbi:MAG: hypothetical protein ABSB29_05450 [Nitrososphaerales archaeon]|jgi:hypothetical protein